MQNFILILVFSTALAWIYWEKCLNGKLSSLKIYRKYKGGTWYRYSPKMFPYMFFWTQDENIVSPHERINLIEKY